MMDDTAIAGTAARRDHVEAGSQVPLFHCTPLERANWSSTKPTLMPSEGSAPRTQLPALVLIS
jgi:hypothetical protein